LYHLSVSLQSLDDDSRDYDIPDYEFDSPDLPPQGLYERASAVDEASYRRKFPVLWIILGILILLFIGTLIYVLCGRKNALPTETNIPPAVENPVTEPSPLELPKEIPIIQAPPVQAKPAETSPIPPRIRPATDLHNTVVETIPKDGVIYKIRWGDTLWDISEAYYRNPWLYPRIARFNGISNPDRIISGRSIRIPPKN
jgi:hypothetical protein